jgi:hypothetical protein
MVHPNEQVGEAVCLDSLSYHEAWELSYFGASVLHPRTTMPAMKYNIPITIRNFFNRGTSGDLPLLSVGILQARISCKKSVSLQPFVHQGALVVLSRLDVHADLAHAVVRLCSRIKH